MKTGYFNLVIIIVGGAIIALISVQLFWVRSAVKLSEKEFNSSAIEALNTVGNIVEDNIGCFEIFAKTYIRPGQGFYILKHKWENGKYLAPDTNNIDTVGMYFLYSEKKDTSLYAFSQMQFATPATAEIMVKFEYQLADTTKFKSNTDYAPDFKGLTAKNFKEKFSSNKQFINMIDTALMDTLLIEEFEKYDIHGDFQWGAKKAEADTFEFIKHSGNEKKLNSSAIKTILFNDKYFSEPYEVVVSFNYRPIAILRSLWVSFISSAVIIIILILGFSYFIKIIIRQKKISDIKRDFINNMTHEFNTPLATISLAGQALKDTRLIKDQDSIHRYASIINNQSERLFLHIDSILQMAVVENSKIALTLKEVNLHQLILKTIEHFQLQVENGKGVIKADLRATSFEVEADKVHLNNIIHNLIDNAIKYSKDKIDILIETYNSFTVGQGVFIKISDRGIGIKKEDLNKIFDSFYRANPGDVHNVKGFGIGLSYVKKMLDAHGATIKVTSQFDEGSSFEIFFPFSPIKPDK